MARLDLNEVKSAAWGNWDNILSSLAPALHPALARPGKHVDCPNPSHGGKNDFRLHKDYVETGGAICTCNKRMNNGFSVLMWINGWDFKTALFEVAEVLGFDTSNPTPRPRIPVDIEELERKKREKEKKRKVNDEKIQTALNRVWQETLPAEHPDAEPLRLYMVRRGLPSINIPETLRFHPNLPYWEDDSLTGYWPAIVALVQAPDGSPVTLHRIFLDKSGNKAPVLTPKKLMPRPSFRTLSGAAIRLGPASKTMGLTEGVETGLAVQTATGMSVWATITAVLMEQWINSDVTDFVCVYADKDISETGHNSASVVVQKLSEKGCQAVGLLPSMAIPSGKSIDWLDVFNTNGTDAIPNYKKVQQLLLNAERKRT